MRTLTNEQSAPFVPLTSFWIFETFLINFYTTNLRFHSISTSFSVFGSVFCLYAKFSVFLFHECQLDVSFLVVTFFIRIEKIFCYALYSVFCVFLYSLSHSSFLFRSSSAKDSLSPNEFQVVHFCFVKQIWCWFHALFLRSFYSAGVASSAILKGRSSPICIFLSFQIIFLSSFFFIFHFPTIPLYFLFWCCLSFCWKFCSISFCRFYNIWCWCCWCCAGEMIVRAF